MRCPTESIYRTLLLIVLAFLPAILPGCAAMALLGNNKAEKSLDDLTSEEEEEQGTPLISRYAHPYGLNYVKVESVALVTGLAGTGEDPPLTPQRAALLDEMNRRRVDKPNRVLASSDTSLVLLRAYLPPGVRKGDHLDIEVRTPTRSHTTSLRGGWVLPSRLSELAVLGQQIRSGHVLATAEGAVLVDPSAEKDGDVAIATRGRILGGCTALKSRPLGLILSQEHQSVRMSQAISKAINDRFHRYDAGRQVGVAVPKTDEFIELEIHERYKDNITRYVRVIRHLAIRESSTERQERLVLLEKQLLDPLTASTASLRLEAIGGEQAVERLLKGIASDDPEVRFYSAEALAYLDETAGAKALAEAARNEPAFRAHALAALSAMDDVTAYDSLRDLLSSSSAETRYGAFRALWAMNENDPLIHGERLGGQFSFHRLDVKGPPMIHSTRSGRPELVLFGKDQRFKLPLVLDAGQDILVNGLTGDEVVVSRFTAGESTRKRIVSTRVEEVIRAIVELGGTYPDVVQALQEAKSDDALASRFRVDAIPRAGREYDRDDPELASNDSEEGAPDADGGYDPETDAYQVATPLPDLFSRKK